MTRRIVTVISTITTAGAIAVTATGAPAQDAAFGPSNPFYAPSTLPFHAPHFDKIKDSDYQPAIEAGMAQMLDETRAIANNPAPPTFENTIVAMEKTGQLLDRVMHVFNWRHRRQHQPRPAKSPQPRNAPNSPPRSDAIYLNPKLFQRVSKIYDQRHSLNLDPESLRLVEYDYQ